MVGPCGLAGVGCFDARKDDHAYGRDAFAEYCQRLVVRDAKASLATLFAVIGAPTKTSLLGCGLGSSGSRGCAVPAGVRCAQQLPRSTHVLRPTTSPRRHPLPSPQDPCQPTGRHSHGCLRHQTLYDENHAWHSDEKTPTAAACKLPATRPLP